MYDGVRRRAIPLLLDALKPGNDADRIKGALWTLNQPSFGKYAISGESGLKQKVSDVLTNFLDTEPTLANELLSQLFACQSHEKVNYL